MSLANRCCCRMEQLMVMLLKGVHLLLMLMMGEQLSQIPLDELLISRVPIHLQIIANNNY